MMAPRRRLLRVTLLLVALAAAACGNDASPSITDPKGPAAERINSVWWLMFGLATAVYIVVAALIIMAALRGRGTGGEGKPSRISEGKFIWIGGLIVPTVILGVLAVVTVQTTDALRQPDKNPLKIEVTAHQYWWAVRYPQQDITTANEIRVPAGRPVEMGLRSDDVIHSFWVPQLAGKVDSVPGQRNVIRFTAESPGEYRGFCAEYCGVQHAKMQFLVIAETPGAYERWVARQQRPRSGPSNEREAAGELAFMKSTCAGCHAVKGTEARGTIGPDLSDLGSRRTLGAVSVPNNRANLAGFISDSQKAKPGNLMPPIHLDPDDLNAIVDYLESQR
jgi:cytochrome c oxidase subunit 2